MPTNHEETLHERYAREHEAEMAMLAKMKPEEIHGLCLQLHNALAERDALAAEMAAIKGQKPVAFAIGDVDGSLNGLGAIYHSEAKARHHIDSYNGKLVAAIVPLYALPPAPPATEQSHNQCDGCQAGIPLVNGTHRMGRTGGYPDLMGCTAHLYKPSAEGEGVAALDRNAAFKACPDTGCDWSSFYSGWKAAIKAVRAEQQKGEK